MKIQRTKMPEQDAAKRGHNFLEVNLGLPAECAQQESMRCIECKDPKCISTCPVGVKVREFLDLILEGDYLGAAAKIREDNALPAITGRVCPQEDQCEGGCLLGKKGAPLAIGYLERFVADYEQETGQLGIPPIAPADRQESCHRRQRPGGPELRRRPHPEGPSRTRLRGAALLRWIYLVYGYGLTLRYHARNVSLRLRALRAPATKLNQQLIEISESLEKDS